MLVFVSTVLIWLFFQGETPYEEGGEVAIKIFKTTLNEFRDREQYIAGTFNEQIYKKGNERTRSNHA